VSWLVDYLYVGFAKIFPTEKILYAKNVTTITIRKCQQRVTSTNFSALRPNAAEFNDK